MRKLNLILVVLISILNFGKVAAFESIYFHHLTTQNGLSQNIVSDICQDKNGYIWISTRNGLNRFDGGEIKKYFHNQNDSLSLPENNISSSIIDNENNLWFVSKKVIGLYREETDDFKEYKFKQSDEYILYLPLKEYFESCRNFPIQHFVADKNLITYIPEKDQFSPFRPNIPELKGHKIYHAYLKDENTLWLFSDKKNKSFLTCYDYLNDKYTIRSVNIPHIISAFTDRNGKVYLGSWLNGLWEFDEKEGKSKRVLFNNSELNEKLKNKIVSDMVEDKEDNLWVAVWGLGIVKISYKTNEVKLFSYQSGEDNSLGSNTSRYLLVSNDGLVWVGSLSKGVSYFDPSNQDIDHIKSTNSENSLSSNSVYALLEDQQRNVWVGTDGGGLNILDKNKQFKIYNTQNGLTSDTVVSLFEDKNNDIWIGNWYGYLQKYNSKTKKITTFDGVDDVLCSEKTSRDIVSFNDNEIIICGEFAGVTSYNYEKNEFEVWKDYKGEEIRSYIGSVYSITQDPNGLFWIGGQTGLIVYDRETKRITYPKLETGIKKNHFFIWNLLLDEVNECIWVGGSGLGLKKIEYKTEELKSIPFLNNSSFDVVYGILKESSTILWLSTASGLYSIDLENENVENFDKSNGLQDYEFTQGAFAKLSDGRMMFGGQFGFNIIEPKKMKIDETVSPIVFNNIKIKNKPYYINDYSQLNEIPYEKNSVSFEFSVLDFSFHNQVKYKYMLKNYDEDWIVGGSNLRFARYQNLPSGNYDFIVKAANSDGVWNEKGKSIKIRILKPFWEKWWFITLILILFSFLVYCLYNARIQYIVDKNKRLQAMINESVAEVKKQKGRLEGIFYNAIAGVIITDKDLNILFANKHFEELVKNSYEKAKDFNLKRYFEKEDIKDIKLKQSEIVDSESSFYTNVKLNSNNEDSTWVGLSCSKIHEGNKVQFLFVLIDITEQKESEARILELERKNSASAMAVTANHELNQPLMVIQGNIEMLLFSLKDTLNEKQQNKINKVLDSIAIMTTILNKYKNNKDLSFDSYTEETDMVTFDEIDDDFEF